MIKLVIKENKNNEACDMYLNKAVMQSSKNMKLPAYVYSFSDLDYLSHKLTDYRIVIDTLPIDDFPSTLITREDLRTMRDNKIHDKNY